MTVGCIKRVHIPEKIMFIILWINKAVIKYNMDLDTEKVINLVFPEGIPGKSLKTFISRNTLMLLFL